MDTERLEAVERLLPETLRSLFGPGFRWAHQAMKVHTVNRVAELAVRVLPQERWEEGVTREELVEVVHADDDHAFLVDWILGLLEGAGRLRQAEGRWWAPTPLAEPRPLPRSEAADPRLLAATQPIVDHIAERGAEVLRGERRGEEVVFSRESFAMWFRYFSNDNVLYEPNNRLAARALAAELPDGARIAELGGGTGSAGVALAEEMAARGRQSSPVSYRFTELSPAFERRGGRMVRAAWPEEVVVTAEVADFDQPLTQQGFAAGELDAIWAVNALHAAHDLLASLTYVREALRPGGVLVLGECIRPRPGTPVFTEFLFAFLESYRSAPLGPLRSMPGFLTAGEWRDHLQAAGFGEVRVVPDVERIQAIYPDFLVGAIVARRTE